MRVLVCGSRTWPEAVGGVITRVLEGLSSVADERYPLVVIDGRARGADAVARQRVRRQAPPARRSASASALISESP